MVESNGDFMHFIAEYHSLVVCFNFLSKNILLNSLTSHYCKLGTFWTTIVIWHPNPAMLDRGVARNFKMGFQ